MEKEKWEKPELSKLGLEIAHCCVLDDPYSGSTASTGDEGPFFSGD